jgi:hypothetical protein
MNAVAIVAICFLAFLWVARQPAPPEPEVILQIERPSVLVHGFPLPDRNPKR